MAELDLVKIGNFIKERRMELNFSIRELSMRSDIAAGTISQIETGKTSPNIMSLNAICNALNFPVSALFVEKEQEKVHLVRKNERQSFVRNVSNGKELVESLITKGVNDMWGGVVEIPANTDSGNYYYHEGEELVFILKGTLVFDLENYGKYRLQEEDSLYYPNRIGHRWINESEQTTHMLIVSTSPYDMNEI